MSRDTSITLSRNTKAGGLVAASVFLISFLPVFVAFSGTESPFLFGCVWRIGLALGLAAFLAGQYPDLLRSRSAWRRVGHHISSIGMVVWIASQFQIALFAWSATVTD